MIRHLIFFTRFLWLIPLEKKEAALVAEALVEVFQLFGPPEILLTDNGSEFRGAVASVASQLGFSMRHGRPHHPQTTGKVLKMCMLYGNALCVGLRVCVCVCGGGAFRHIYFLLLFLPHLHTICLFLLALLDCGAGVHP